MTRNIISLLLALAFAHAATAQDAPARLAVRMDDMGAFHSVNAAIMDIYQDGISRSVEIMPVTAWYPEAVKMLAQAPGMDVGVHLAMTSEWENVKWRPLTPCPSLVDSMGYFRPMMKPNAAYPGQSVKERGYDIREVEREFRAQIERALKDVPQLSHISDHMGSARTFPEISDLIDHLAREYGLPFVDASDKSAMNFKRVNYTDANGKGGPHRTLAEKEESFINMLRTLKPGHNYMFLEHPAYDDTEMAPVFHIGNENTGFDRQGVTDLYKSPRVKEALREYNIQLIRISDLWATPTIKANRSTAN